MTNGQMHSSRQYVVWLHSKGKTVKEDNLPAFVSVTAAIGREYWDLCMMYIQVDQMAERETYRKWMNGAR